jgi:ATP-binding cassette subfamily B protein/subfamily B ATP-binding cassette protein MsbA
LLIYASLKPVEASVDRVVELLDAREVVEEETEATLLPGPRSHCGFGIQIHEVTAGYQPWRPALRGVTLDIAPGETLALIGATGAGKSTLLALIPRFLDPWRGSVLLDGRDVRSLRLESLRNAIAVVFQEPLLLPRTVAENIAYGRPGATRQEIEQAAESAGATSFIQQLPAGYDTVLGERGETLSVGQRQRISIARALLKDSPILLLDEPTSALDVETEASIVDALDRLRRGRTTLLVSHRLAAVQGADRVAALRQGQLVECGSIDDLLKSGGVYARMTAAQQVHARQEAIA